MASLGVTISYQGYTDHQALISLLRKDDAHGRIVKWQIQLSEYDVKYIHIPGRENVLADGMSLMKVCESMLAEVRKALDKDLEVYLQEGESTSGWEEWLEDEWYREIVHLKLFGDLSAYRDSYGEPLTLHQRRLIHQKSTPFQLLHLQPAESSGSTSTNITGIRITGAGHPTTKPSNRVVFVERNGKEAVCVRGKQVPAILQYLHDCHGHFAAGVLSRTPIGGYYWHSRTKDIHSYCATCPSCQLIGPLRPSVIQMAIVHLQPLDMMGFDFVGRFPDTQRGNKYIIIGVGNFTRSLFAAAVPDSQAKSAVSLLMGIVKQFGWPRAVYTDNGAHFVGGEFAKTLQNFHVVHLLAPK